MYPQSMFFKKKLQHIIFIHIKCSIFTAEEISEYCKHNFSLCHILSTGLIYRSSVTRVLSRTSTLLRHIILRTMSYRFSHLLYMDLMFVSSARLTFF